MNNKTILTGAIVIIILFGLMFWGKTVARPVENHAGAPDGGVASVLIVSEKLFDFGSISMKRGTVEHTFIITNPSSAPLELAQIYTSCMCTRAFLETSRGEQGPFGMQGMGYGPAVKETIGSGESRIVRVVFDPNAHGPAGVGAIDRFAYIVDASGAVLSVEIKANVTP